MHVSCLARHNHRGLITGYLSGACRVISMHFSGCHSSPHHRVSPLVLPSDCQNSSSTSFLIRPLPHPKPLPLTFITAEVKRRQKTSILRRRGFYSFPIDTIFSLLRYRILSRESLFFKKCLFEIGDDSNIFSLFHILVSRSRR